MTKFDQKPESSDLCFFRTTAGIQSGPDAFGKLSSAMTFLTNVEVTEILRTFRLVLEV